MSIDVKALMILVAALAGCASTTPTEISDSAPLDTAPLDTAVPCVKVVSAYCDSTTQTVKQILGTCTVGY